MHRAKAFVCDIDMVPESSLAPFEPDTADLAATLVMTINQKTGFDANPLSARKTTSQLLGSSLAALSSKSR
jgi:hypothetical protein